MAVKNLDSGVFPDLNPCLCCSVQFSRSIVSNSLRPHGLQTSLSITNSQSLLKLMSIEPVMPSNHLILCHPLPLPPSIIPSIWVFLNESILHIRWLKYWSFHFRISCVQLFTTPWALDPTDYTVHGILQARILEQVAFHFSRGSSQPGDRTQVSCIAGGFFTS